MLLVQTQEVVTLSNLFRYRHAANVVCYTQPRWHKSTYYFLLLTYYGLRGMFLHRNRQNNLCYCNCSTSRGSSLTSIFFYITCHWTLHRTVIYLCSLYYSRSKDGTRIARAPFVGRTNFSENKLRTSMHAQFASRQQNVLETSKKHKSTAYSFLRRVKHWLSKRFPPPYTN